MGDITLSANESAKASNSWWIIFWSIVGSILFLFVLIWFFYLRHIAYTDDAYVHGNKIIITPMQDGVIVRIHTDDTFLVDQGQVIAELDPTYALIALNRAQENLANVVRELCQVFHRTFSLQADIEARLADLVIAKQDWNHRIDVIEQGGVSLENLQHSEAVLKSAFFMFKSAESLYLREKALIDETSIRSNPMVKKAEDELKDAVVRLFRTKVYAPNKGLIAQRNIQVGMHVKAGDPLMSVIPLDQIWINANYKETQMDKMRIGQTVQVMADLYGFGVIFHGTIVGLPGGAGNAFSLLPPQNLSGNWIKIVQRLPVRIALRPEELKRHPLRIGMTMRALTDLRFSGEIVPTTTVGPLYTTEILLEEEKGAKEMSDEIISANIDASLKPFEHEKFTSEYIPFAGELELLFDEEVSIGNYQ